MNLLPNIQENPPSDFEDAIVVLPLSNSSEICLINYSKYERASQYKWRYNPQRDEIITDIKYKTITLSRFLCRKGADHKDHNRFNNTKDNLRPASTFQQACNKRKRSGTRSIYKGVWFFTTRNKWVAEITANGIRHHLGYFLNEIDAAKAYDKKAIELHKAFASLNFPLVKN